VAIKQKANNVAKNNMTSVLWIDPSERMSAAEVRLFKTALEANPKIEQFWLSYIDALIKDKQFDNAKQVLEQGRNQGVAGEKFEALEEHLTLITQAPQPTLPEQKKSLTLSEKRKKLAEQKKQKKAKKQNLKAISPSQAQLSSLLEHYQNGRFDDAEKLAVSITQEFAKHQFGWKVLGAVLKQTGRISESLAASQKSVQLAPQDAAAHGNLGVTLQELGRLDEAEASCRQAISLKPDYAEAHYNLGVTLQALGRLDEAAAHYTQAITLKPDYAEAHCNLGVMLQELGTLDEANVSYKQAIALKPDYFEAHRNLGIVLQELDRLDEAEASYKQAISLKPDYAEAHYNLGVTLNELGRLDEAQTSLRQVIALKPDYVEAYNNLGAMLQERGRLDEAEVTYKQAISLKLDYTEAHYNLGNTLKELGRLDEAQTSYKQAIALKPDYAEAHNNLAITLQALGRFDEAEVSYRQVMALKPHFAGAHSSFGSMLNELGRFEESVSSFQHAFANRTGIRPVGDDVLAPATTSVYFELTNKCNFHCDFCPSDSQKRDIGSMDLELVKQLYEENADKKLSNIVNLHLMGEPTLHPALIEILKFGASKNVKTDLVTNISTLVAKNVPKILDALYGTLTASHMTPTEETYHFRGEVGLSWDRYIGNLRLLVREYMKRLAKGKSIENNITIRVMVTQNTASNVNIIGTSNEAGAILKEWNDFVAEVEQELGMAPFKRKDHNANDLVRGNNHSSTSYPLQQGIKLTFWRAFTFANTRVSDDFDLKTTRQTSYCSHPFTDVGVLWNGDVTLCCLDHDGELKVGNVRDSSMETVIQSDAAQKLRASMLGDYPLPSICQTCQERPVKRENA
jgi:tetratricopeptide (TPR) repeat protein/MoaA/NifB/PqqE/SkfB family radical SAM enzyme